MSTSRTTGSEGAQDLRGASLLVVDDEESLREMLQILLVSRGASVVTAGDGKAAVEALEGTRFDAIITDISMPVLDGHGVLRHVRQHRPEVPVIMMTAVAKDVADAVEAIKRGAFDYIQKGYFNNDEFLRRVTNAVEHSRLREENLRLRSQLEGRRQNTILGRSERMRSILSVVERVAPTSSTVLVTGESGVGKELIARTIHHNSGRTGKFVAVNCGAFTDELLESELFGHAKGAFTGASTAHRGFFEEAHGGTLFLDEVGEMSPAMQVKLLRALQEGVVRPVGTTEERTVDVRVITATNRDLEEMVREGSFREDLYYRVNVVTLGLPTLAERREDIPVLATRFLRSVASRYGRPVRGFSPDSMELLMAAPWPGNVRQLHNAIEKAVALCTEPIVPTALMERILATPVEPQTSLDTAKQAFERDYVVQLLKQTRGNVTDAARLAQRNRSEFYALLRRHSLDPKQFKDTDR